MKPELIADYHCVTGEGPIWHADEKRLYWVDIPQGRLFRYDPASGQHEMCFESDEALGGCTIQADGTLLFFMARGAVKQWNGDDLTTIIEEIPDERETRFNDIIADPEGRVYCGTMPTQERGGRLYRLDTDGSLTVVVEEAGVSNGMGFTGDLRYFYHTNTTARTITRYQYDRASGDISNGEVVVQLPQGVGSPDGMTVDAEDHIWSARWDGSSLVRFTPEGEEVMRVQFPAKKVSSVVFGGEDYTDMYVTTAGGNAKDENGEGAGALFRLNLGIKGRPEFRSQIQA